MPGLEIALAALAGPSPPRPVDGGFLGDEVAPGQCLGLDGQLASGVPGGLTQVSSMVRMRRRNISRVCGTWKMASYSRFQLPP